MSGGFRGFGSATSQRRSNWPRTSGRRWALNSGSSATTARDWRWEGTRCASSSSTSGEAQARGADTVLVTGAVQSNLIRIAAAGARRLGLDIHVQLEERVADVGEVYHTSGNVLLDRVLGATLHSFPVGEDEAAADAAMEGRARTLQPRAARRMSFIRPPGIGRSAGSATSWPPGR